MSVPATIVVVPARDERARIGACLRALAAQTVSCERFRVVLVLDGCRDDTGAVAIRTARRLGLGLMVIAGPGAGPGPARRTGMDVAAELLHAATGGLIASTDADSVVAPDWLERQHAHHDRGAQAIGGLIELDPAEAAALPAHALRRRAALAAARLREVRTADPAAAHHHFAGASFAVSADVYRAVGGLEPVSDLEDAAFARRLAAHGITVLRAADVRVTTSARRSGRARRGLAADLAALSRPTPGGDEPSRPCRPASAPDGRAARRA